jgi:hypothetical protein
MGQLLPAFKKATIDEIIDNISTNTAHYYCFGAHPISYTGGTPNTAASDIESSYLNNWTMLFGKKLSNTNIVPMISNIPWTINAVYTKYDNTSNTLSNSQFYVVMPPGQPGGTYNVFKCINNANGAPSIQPPDQIQPQSFTKSDGYTWRYIYSISSSNYTKFGTDDYVPVYSDPSIVLAAYDYSGVEVVMISNSGVGYNAYNDGVIRGVISANLIQIESTASTDNNFYTGSAIYIYNTSTATSQLRVITQYTSNLSGNWVSLDRPANTTNITPSITQYKISPQVKFDTDGEVNPAAYSIVNTFSNSISSVVIIEPGYGISRANCSIVSNTTYGTGANVYAIVPPPGGHGFNPAVELDAKAIGLSFSFNKSEANNISANCLYNKIGVLKNPYALTANAQKGILYTSQYFDQRLIANVSPSAQFSNGEIVQGQTSGALGVVVFSNTSQIQLVGDKQFSNGEFIVSSNGSVSTTIDINTLGDIYTKDINPLYVQNIDNTVRTSDQSETFKIVISI